MDVDRETLFVINKINYYKHYASFYEQMQKFTPRNLLQIPIILPFYIPFRDGTNTTFILDDEKSACTLHFAPINTTQSINPGIITDDELKVSVQRSRVEMAYLSEAPIQVSSDEDVSVYFDMMLKYLNHILLSYLITFKDLDAHRISREMLQFSFLYRLILLNPWSEKATGLFVMNINIPTKKEVVTPEKERELIWYANVLKQKWNPFMLSEEFALDARRNIAHGFYRESIIHSQTSIETFLNILFIHLLRCEGKTIAEAETAHETIAFLQMVKKEFHPRLGGKWNVDDASTEIGKWYSGSYNLRNRIAHAGYYPSFAECAIAINVSERFRAYVLGLVRAKKSKYPDIIKFFDK